MAATLAYASNLIGPPIFGAVASVSRSARGLSNAPAGLSSDPRSGLRPATETFVRPWFFLNPEALTATGWKRATALVGLFDPAGGTSPRLPLAKPTRLLMR